ncbi:MAG: succinate dehydrogenase cytochrome b subunit [Euzebyales bacterium]|nr:succinate dehydrogenase cytochrome b subunit [Euzebyales bacterium]MBA3621996.1 succinate dehydrogenase cytochrome b subunit [Euzebyales bacterium]
MAIQEPVDSGRRPTTQERVDGITPTGRGSGASARGADAGGADVTRRKRAWAVEFYRSAIGKKYVMAVTGLILMVFVVAHMVGNLKLYLGAEPLNVYAEWLRDVGYPALPHSGLLWIMRGGLIVAFVLHLHAAWALTRMNRRARPQGYASKRDYLAADFAARTMRWSGIIVLLFIAFHLADLTFGVANTAEFTAANPYANTVRSFQRWPVSVFYILANVALGIHLFHGAWSMFQSMGINNRRFNHWRRHFATAFAVVVTLGNVSFPVAVLAGIVA